MHPVGFAADKAERISRALEKQLGAGGPTLRKKLRRVGRELPKDIRQAAERLADASELSRNPKLASRTDPAGIEDDFAKVSRYLSTIDPADRRRRRMLSFLAALAFNAILAFVAIVAVLAWRGFL